MQVRDDYVHKLEAERDQYVEELSDIACCHCAVQLGPASDGGSDIWCDECAAGDTARSNERLHEDLREARTALAEYRAEVERLRAALADWQCDGDEGQCCCEPCNDLRDMARNSAEADSVQERRCGTCEHWRRIGKIHASEAHGRCDRWAGAMHYEGAGTRCSEWTQKGTK